MSWHLSYRLTNQPLASLRLTAMHKAVSIGLLCSTSAVVLSPTAQAATMSETVVASAQYQPLVALISVTDINAADFSASLANPVVYQQMGLSATDSMSVHFVPTSATTGTLVLSTTEPVSMPFADVVLAINNNGQRNIIPKTLLMPLAKSVPIKPPAQVIAAAQTPHISVVNDDNVAQILTVKRGAPPPLFASPSSQLPSSQVPSLQMPSTRMATMQAQVAMPAAASSITAAKTNISTINRSTPSLIADNSVTKASIIKNNTADNVAVSSVKRVITSSIQPASAQAARAPVLQAARSANNNADTVTTLDLGSIPSRPSIDNNASSEANLNQLKAMVQTSLPTRARTQSATDKVASKNKLFDTLNIQVSRQIKLSNPTAVASPPLILANNTVDLDIQPNTLAAQKPSSRQIDKPTTATTADKSSSREVNTTAATTQTTATESAIAKSVSPKIDNKPIDLANTLSPAQVPMLASTLSDDSATAAISIDTDISSLLKKSRQRTATQAKPIKANHSTLSVYREKLQLQKQKRVELEARFKKLRHQ